MAPATAALWRYAIAIVALMAFAYAFEGGLAAPRRRGSGSGSTLLGATGVCVFNLCFMYGLARVPASRGVAHHGAQSRGDAARRGAVPARASHAQQGARHRGRAGRRGGRARARQSGAISFAAASAIGEIVLFGCPLSWAANTLIAKNACCPTCRHRGDDVVGDHRDRHARGRRRVHRPASRRRPCRGARGRPSSSSRSSAPPSAWCCSTTACAGSAPRARRCSSTWCRCSPWRSACSLLGEPLEASMLVGGALVIAGIFLLNRPRAAPRGSAASHAA